MNVNYLLSICGPERPVRIVHMNSGWKAITNWDIFKATGKVV